MEYLQERFSDPKAHTLPPRSQKACRQFGPVVKRIGTLSTQRKYVDWVNILTCLSGAIVFVLPYKRINSEVLDVRTKMIHNASQPGFDGQSLENNFGQNRRDCDDDAFQSESAPHRVREGEYVASPTQPMPSCFRLHRCMQFVPQCNANQRFRLQSILLQRLEQVATPSNTKECPKKAHQSRGSQPFP